MSGKLVYLSLRTSQYVCTLGLHVRFSTIMLSMALALISPAMPFATFFSRIKAHIHKSELECHGYIALLKKHKN